MCSQQNCDSLINKSSKSSRTLLFQLFLRCLHQGCTSNVPIRVAVECVSAKTKSYRDTITARVTQKNGDCCLLPEAKFPIFAIRY